MADESGGGGLFGKIRRGLDEALYEQGPVEEAPEAPAPTSSGRPPERMSLGGSVAEEASVSTGADPALVEKANAGLDGLMPESYQAFLKLDEMMKKAIPDDSGRLVAVLIALEAQGHSKESITAGLAEYREKIDGYRGDFTTNLEHRSTEESASAKANIERLTEEEAELGKQIADLSVKLEQVREDREAQVADRDATLARYRDIAATFGGVVDNRLELVAAEQARLNPATSKENADE